MRGMRSSIGPRPTPLPGAPRSALQTVRSLLPYLWPKGDHIAHLRLVLACLFLIAAKVATVYVPLVYSHAVDALVPKAGAAVAVPVALIVGYGLLRVASSGFGELRDAVFAAVQQRTVRLVALQAFRHMHLLSLRFHLDRQTGGLSRGIERGTTGIDNVLRMAVFNVIPTLIEVLMVAGDIVAPVRLAVRGADGAGGGAVSGVHAGVHQLAGEYPAEDERERQRCAVQGGGQPAELRNREIFRQ